jgi:hypothetical protein
MSKKNNGIFHALDKIYASLECNKKMLKITISVLHSLFIRDNEKGPIPPPPPAPA